MKSKHMAEKNEFEPGAAHFGNFINYYEFNPPSNRLALFDDKFCEYVKNDIPSTSITCLDIGCNTGELSLALHQLLSRGSKKVHVLGVDLDPVLVQRANEKTTDATSDAIEFQTVNAMDAELRDQVWRQYLHKHSQRQRFDFIFCFSTTMWIHLNHGDQGLEDFLSTLAHWGDNVIVEPQPWKCYRNAVRRAKKTKSQPFVLYDSLHYRTNIVQDIQDILHVKLGMHLHAHMGQSQWDRSVLWFKHSH